MGDLLKLIWYAVAGLFRRRFGVMCAEQGACVRRRSWAGYTVNMFEFAFPTGTGMTPLRARRWPLPMFISIAILPFADNRLDCLAIP
jgi:hypothetical protein